MTPVDIVTLLRRSRLRVGDEAALKLSIEEALTAAGAGFEREHRLSAADRIDFLFASVGLEAKTRCNKRHLPPAVALRRARRDQRVGRIKVCSSRKNIEFYRCQKFNGGECGQISRFQRYPPKAYSQLPSQKK